MDLGQLRIILIGATQRGRLVYCSLPGAIRRDLPAALICRRQQTEREDGGRKSKTFANSGNWYCRQATVRLP